MSILPRYDIEGGDDAGIFAEESSDGVWCYADEALAQIAELTTELAASGAQEPIYQYASDIGRQWSDIPKEVYDEYASRGGGWITRIVYAAPVSEAKAQSAAKMPCGTAVSNVCEAYDAGMKAAKARGVVMPDRLKPSRYELQDARVDAWNACLDEVARLNAAPVQQVSVPDGWKLVPAKETAEMRIAGKRAVSAAGALICAITLHEIYESMLVAAPAAPAADAGLVEALEKLARLGNGDKYGNSEGNFIARAALAAHRAQGVV